MRQLTASSRVASALCKPAMRRVSTASAAAAPEEGTTTRRIGAAVFSGIVGVTGCLTVWQMQRYTWKLQLIEDRKAALEGEPQALRALIPELAVGTAEDLEYRRVVVEGTFDHSQQSLVGPRSAPPSPHKGAPGAPNASGWDVLTPFVCADGSRVLVNRGWVPHEAVDALEQPSGHQRIDGVLKRGERENKYAVNTPAAGRYVWLDLPTLADITDSAPVLIVASDSTAGGGGRPPAQWPRARPRSSFLEFYVEPNTHLVYAATWASLTAAGALITVKRFLR